MFLVALLVMFSSRFGRRVDGDASGVSFVYDGTTDKCAHIISPSKYCGGSVSLCSSVYVCSAP